jgi:hypothetical protein
MNRTKIRYPWIAGRLDSRKVPDKFHSSYDDNLARTYKLNALPYDILASKEVITLLMERHMRFFSIRGGFFKPRPIFCDLFAGPKNLGF